MRQNISILLLSSIFTLLSLELVVRVFDFAPKVYSLAIGKDETAYKLSENKILGYELKKNFRSKNPDFHHSYRKTNSFGFRDKERTLTKSIGKKRILFLGDSVTIGQGIKDLKNTIPLVMEKNLGPDFEVFNMGLTGYCTFGEIELLKTKGLKFKPDVVIVLFTDNDFIESNGSLIDQIVEDKSARRLKLLRFFSLFRVLENYYHDSIFSKRGRNSSAIGDQNVQRGLAELVEMSKQHNFETLIAVWPSFSDRSVFHKPDQYLKENQKQLRIETIAKQLNIPTLQILPAFEQHLTLAQMKIKKKRISPNWSYTIGDSMHPNEQGARIAGEYIAKKFLEIDILKAR